MCDQHTQENVDEFLSRSGMTRRQFGRLSAAVGMAMMLPPVANAQDVAETDVEVTTPDGVADCYFVHPSAGRNPAVLVWPDIPRPAAGLQGYGQTSGPIRLFCIGRKPVLSGRKVTSCRRRCQLWSA